MSWTSSARSTSRSPQDEFDTTAGYYDINYMTGELAESWEIASDVSSFTFKIRENVNWHNKAPMNGRQLNANDVAHHFQRIWGVGDFADDGPSPHIWGLPNVPATAAEATGDFEFKVDIHTPGLDHLGTILGILTPSDVHPPEVIEQYGDMRNWEVVVGTGPVQYIGLRSRRFSRVREEPGLLEDRPPLPRSGLPDSLRRQD